MAQLRPHLRIAAADQKIRDQQKIAQIILETGDTHPDIQPRHGKATAAGDSRKLRGIPAYAHGVTGVITGGNHYAQLMAQRPAA